MSVADVRCEVVGGVFVADESVRNVFVGATSATI